MTKTTEEVAVPNTPSAIWQEIAIDIDKENGGVWQEVATGTRFKIAMQGNKAYNQAIQKYSEKREELQKQHDGRSIGEVILAYTAAEALVMEWEGMTDIKGNPLECSMKNKVNILLDPRLRKLADKVIEFAQSSANFRIDDIGGQEKN